MPSKHLILCRPLLLPPSILPSIRSYSKESVLRIRCPKNWSFSVSISPSNEYSGLISFRMDWLDLLAVQGTLKSLLQHHSSEASVLSCSAFFMVQLSHPYMTTGKTVVMTRWTFVGKVMFLLFNMLSRFFIAFLPRSKCLWISWLHSPFAVILEPPKICSEPPIPRIVSSVCIQIWDLALFILSCFNCKCDHSSALPFSSPLLFSPITSFPVSLFIPNKNSIHFSNRQTGTDIFAVSEKYAEANSHTLELLLGEFVVVEGLL